MDVDIPNVNIWNKEHDEIETSQEVNEKLKNM